LSSKNKKRLIKMEGEEVIEPSTLLGMPYELQQKIALELDIESTLNLCLGAKALRSKICGDDVFWQVKYRMDFGSEKIEDSKSWFENYRIAASVAATMEVFATPTPAALSPEDPAYATLKFLNRDLVSGEVYVATTIELDGSTIERYDDIIGALQPVDPYDFEITRLDTSIFPEKTTENFLHLGIGDLYVNVNKRVFEKLVREFYDMYNNRETGTVRVNLDLSVTKDVTGTF